MRATSSTLSAPSFDLTQAEAVRDLIDSQTLFQAKVAAQQLDGALSNRLKPIKQKLIDLIALLEAGIDFRRGRHLRGPRHHDPQSHIAQVKSSSRAASRHLHLRQNR